MAALYKLSIDFCHALVRTAGHSTALQPVCSFKRGLFLSFLQNAMIWDLATCISFSVPASLTFNSYCY